ncbi:hypothetical protein [Candidatus Palauibacter sp.]|uniref:hypothetical protein n=1 Tax=Candidatus Palauibacter sp. TaxID=3101350 RepID=UPI003B5977FD
MRDSQLFPAFILALLAGALLTVSTRPAQSQSSTGPDLCTYACHGVAMGTYNEALRFGASEEDAIQAGNAAFFACLGEWCEPQ